MPHEVGVYGGLEVGDFPMHHQQVEAGVIAEAFALPVPALELGPNHQFQDLLFAEQIFGGLGAVMHGDQQIGLVPSCMREHVSTPLVIASERQSSLPFYH